MKNYNKENYKIFLTANIINSFIAGIFGPFYILFVQDKGEGLEKFAMAMGLLLLAQSIVAYYAGKYSDIFGRKPLLILEGYGHALVVILFLFVSQIWQLYVLQIIIGVLAGLEATAHTSFLGDVTDKKSRGENIGKYYMIVGIVSALTMMAGGYVIAIIGIKIVFILMVLADIISTSMFWMLREERKVI